MSLYNCTTAEQLLPQMSRVNCLKAALQLSLQLLEQLPQQLYRHCLNSCRYSCLDSCLSRQLAGQLHLHSCLYTARTAAIHNCLNNLNSLLKSCSTTALIASVYLRSYVDNFPKSCPCNNLNSLFLDLLPIVEILNSIHTYRRCCCAQLSRPGLLPLRNYKHTPLTLII